ncbi:MAG: chemotaxis protein CheX [Arenicella sp.]|nr:chemotaxis protein CheX [Arenicella sp.]
MQHQQLINVFIDSVKVYFDHLGHAELDIGTPYLITNPGDIGLDYNGIIAVYGDTNGSIIFSANRSILKYILLSLGEVELNERSIVDLVGEIANTIAGNVRRELGESFQISTPKVTKATLNQMCPSRDPRSFVLPLRWKSKAAQLLVRLD